MSILKKVCRRKCGFRAGTQVRAVFTGLQASDGGRGAGREGASKPQTWEAPGAPVSCTSVHRTGELGDPPSELFAGGGRGPEHLGPGCPAEAREALPESPPRDSGLSPRQHMCACIRGHVSQLPVSHRKPVSLGKIMCCTLGSHGAGRACHLCRNIHVPPPAPPCVCLCVCVCVCARTRAHTHTRTEKLPGPICNLCSQVCPCMASGFCFSPGRSCVGRTFAESDLTVSFRLCSSSVPSPPPPPPPTRHLQTVLTFRCQN